MATASAVLRITVAESAPCEEIGRATRNHVSAYDRARVHLSRIYAAERRCLVTNFHGAIPLSRRIVKAVWETYDVTSVYMSDPAIDGREVKVMIDAQWAGKSRIRVDATLDNGEVYSAWHAVHVLPAPYVGNPQWRSGPKRLEATA